MNNATHFEVRLKGNLRDMMEGTMVAEVGAYVEVYVPMLIFGRPIGTYKQVWKPIYARPATEAEMRADLEEIIDIIVGVDHAITEARADIEQAKDDALDWPTEEDMLEGLLD